MSRQFFFSCHNRLYIFYADLKKPLCRGVNFRLSSPLEWVRIVPWGLEKVWCCAHDMLIPDTRWSCSVHTHYTCL